MNEATKQNPLTEFLKFYTEQNKGRSTRLGVFENGNDFWLEDGLPLAGVDTDTHGESPTIEIMLGNDFTHTVKGAKSIKIHFNFDENSDGLDITDTEGKTTILRFEN
jgi:hypothetical protein